MKKLTLALSMVATLSVACGEEGDTSPTATPEGTPSPTPVPVLDLREELPAPPEGGMQILFPDHVVPAYQDRVDCYFLTYEGDEQGVVEYTSYQVPGMGHHLIIFGTNADPEMYPDGTLMDCTDSNALPMTDVEPMVLPNVIDQTGVVSLNLPDGFAQRLKGGSRLVIQSHYVNTSDRDILVRDGINMGFLAPDLVQTWVAPYAFNLSNPEIPAGSSASASFECTWDLGTNPETGLPNEAHLLTIIPHMHEWGTTFNLESKLGDTRVTLFDQLAWDPSYRDLPPMYSLQPGEMKVTDGEVFRTSCEWFNDEDYLLEFPHEMCVTTGLYYPSKVTYICDRTREESAN